MKRSGRRDFKIGRRGLEEEREKPENTKEV